MQVETREGTQQANVIATGTILSIAYSPELINGLGKEPKTSAHVTTWGIPGDRHYGKTRYSDSQRKTLPNTRPITLMGVEGVREACASLGIPADTVPYGGMGENILTEGLGDLSNAQEGDLLQVLDSEGNPKVILQVGPQNNPCSNLKMYHKQMTRQMMNKRGVVCTVLKEGHFEVGDTVAHVRA